MTTLGKIFGAVAGTALVGGVSYIAYADQKNAEAFKAEHDEDAQKMYEAAADRLSDRRVCEDCYWEAKSVLERVGHEYKHSISYENAKSTYNELMTACDDILHSRTAEVMRRHYERLVTETVVKC